MNIPDIPSDQELAINRDAVISKEQELFARVKSVSLVALNLGCGRRLLDGFINIDKYQQGPGVINSDIFKLSQADNSVDLIFCAHVLEHLPFRHARMALKEWQRVLKPSGKVYLGIPDIGLIMTKMLDPSTADNVREFLMYALFGFQTDPGNRDESILDYPVDEGQFHTCGFTKKSIQFEMGKVGFSITEVLNYDGWSTPSVWVVATKI